MEAPGARKGKHLRKIYANNIMSFFRNVFSCTVSRPPSVSSWSPPPSVVVVVVPPLRRRTCSQWLQTRHRRPLPALRARLSLLLAAAPAPAALNLRSSGKIQWDEIRRLGMGEPAGTAGKKTVGSEISRNGLLIALKSDFVTSTTRTCGTFGILAYCLWITHHASYGFPLLCQSLTLSPNHHASRRKAR